MVRSPVAGDLCAQTHKQHGSPRRIVLAVSARGTGVGWFHNASVLLARPVSGESTHRGQDRNVTYMAQFPCGVIHPLSWRDATCFLQGALFACASDCGGDALGWLFGYNCPRNQMTGCANLRSYGWLDSLPAFPYHRSAIRSSSLMTPSSSSTRSVREYVTWGGTVGS